MFKCCFQINLWKSFQMHFKWLIITLLSNSVHLRLSIIIKSFVHILMLKIILISWTRWNSYNNKICKAGLALHNPTILSFQLDSLEYKVILLLLLLDVVVGNIKGHYCYLLLQHRSQIAIWHYLKCRQIKLSALAVATLDSGQGVQK